MSDFRVLFTPAFENGIAHTFSIIAATEEEARSILNAIAGYTLYLHEASLMPDYSNFGCVEQFIDGEWEELE